ncbi:hypothetical protein AGOR_G00127450 [Albula goreensis]|uniref:Uncharacterized protein n=1 Tax=Albula goreensis TaxID=1534307 RepID=A0A8T3DC04_9TELE|nr:hypothetical protein AGOR_G00127450 [Albula goreensis]
MWRYEKRTTVQHLIHLVERENGKEKYPVLLELLNKHGHIHFLRYLPQILSLQWKLIHFFHYTDVQDWKDMSIDKFAEDCLPDEASFKESVSILLKIWTHMKEIPSQHLSEELRQKDQNNMMIIDLLPQKPSVTRAVTEYLAEMQRDCITCAIPNENRMITAGEVKSSHVITCNPEEDFLPIAISNIDYVVNEDGTESTDYNFKTLEKQLISRFISEKPLINLTTLPSFEVSPVNTLNSFFLKDSVKENLESLNSNDKNCIMNDLRLLNEISAALSTLKIAIGFLELSFGHPDTLLIEYMKNELRMGDRAQHLNLPVLRTSKVKHIQSLWEILSARRSVLLTEMNQNPFFMIDEAFHEALTEDETRKLRRSLETMKKIDFFIIELHDFIMNIKPKGFHSSWTIHETFEPFLDEKSMEEQSIEHLVAPLIGVQMKCIIAVWKLAVHARTN